MSTFAQGRSREADQHERYHLDRWIATGGMGEVWAATDTLLERPVAVKVLRKEYAAEEVLRARFVAEARNAGALSHPNVAAVLDFGELPPSGDAGRTDVADGAADRGRPFLVMELVDGEPLSALLAREGALPPEATRELLSQAADGIAAAHAIGMVHRDVKPGNLMVTPEGQVKVTDFGIARAAGADSLTVTGTLVGTPHYLSPEQAQGSAATPASDVYALGIVLFECLTGRKPFAGESPVATALMQIREPLPALPPELPEQLREIAAVAAAKKPAHRFPDAAAFAAALHDEGLDPHTVGLPVAVPATDGPPPDDRIDDLTGDLTGDPAAGAAPAPAPPPVPAPVPEPRERRRRGLLSLPVLVAAGVLALLLIASLLAWAVLSDPDDPPPAEPRTDDRVRVVAEQYVGLRRAPAARRLRSEGLEPAFRTRRNPGTERAGTVAAVRPTGLLAQGTIVTLVLWGRVPEPDTPTTPGAEESPDGGATGEDAGGGSGSGPATGEQGGTGTPGSSGQGNSGSPGNSGNPGGGQGNSGNGGNGGSQGGGPGKGNGPGQNSGQGQGNGGNQGGGPAGPARNSTSGKGGKR